MLTAALPGLRKGEIRGLCWENFDGKELAVKRSAGNSVVNEPKTKRSKAPIPVVKQLAESLEAHTLRTGQLAVGPIFQAGNGKPLNLDDLARRVISPAFRAARSAGSLRKNTNPKATYSSATIPFPLGTAGTLSAADSRRTCTILDDKTIQGILRHSNTGLTQNIYIKSVNKTQVSTMDALGEKLGTCTVTERLGKLRIDSMGDKWSRGRDLNPRPADYEKSAGEKTISPRFSELTPKALERLNFRCSPEFPLVPPSSRERPLDSPRKSPR